MFIIRILIEFIDTLWAYRHIDGGMRRAPRTSDATDLPESARAHQTLQNSDGDARAWINLNIIFGANMKMLPSAMVLTNVDNSPPWAYVYLHKYATAKPVQFLRSIISPCVGALCEHMKYFHDIKPHVKFGRIFKHKIKITFSPQNWSKKQHFNYEKMSLANYIFWTDSVYPYFDKSQTHTSFLDTYISRFWVAVIFKLPT